jgi:hypothetical protein
MNLDLNKLIESTFIYYLFKLLKENKVIDKETDANGYDGFYEEHMGSSCKWDGSSDLGLIY